MDYNQTFKPSFKLSLFDASMHKLYQSFDLENFSIPLLVKFKSHFSKPNLTSNHKGITLCPAVLPSKPSVESLRVVHRPQFLCINCNPAVIHQYSYHIHHIFSCIQQTKGSSAISHEIFPYFQIILQVFRSMSCKPKF